MSPTIEISEKVKEKLDKYKEQEGIKTFSDAVNVLLILYKNHRNLERLLDADYSNYLANKYKDNP